MEVIEKSAEGLDRQFLVKVSAAELDEKLVAKLNEVKGRINLKGFRKGKAPVSFLKKMYGKGMMSEIIQELVAETSCARQPRRARNSIPRLKTSSRASRILNMTCKRKSCRALSRRMFPKSS